VCQLSIYQFSANGQHNIRLCKAVESKAHCAAKPKARIYRHALEALGVTAEAALFVDDNAAFCAAGAAVGLSAVQIVRGQAEVKVVPGITVVRSLPEVEAMF